jgi:hypothetical protein|nr:MAG TPA: hypothetical protein [Caudoviricetes sp.]
MIYEKPMIMPITVEEIEKGNYQFKFGTLINEDGRWGDPVIIPTTAFKTKDFKISGKLELDPLSSLPEELMDYYKAYCKLDKDDDTSSKFKLAANIKTIWLMINLHGDLFNKFLKLVVDEMLDYRRTINKDEMLLAHREDSIYMDLSTEDTFSIVEVALVDDDRLKFAEYIEPSKSRFQGGFNISRGVNSKLMDDLSEEEIHILKKGVFSKLGGYHPRVADLKEVAKGKLKKVKVEDLKEDNLKPLPEDLTMEKERATYKPNYGKETVDSTWKILWTLVKNNIEDLEVQKELIQEMIEAQEKVIEVQKKVMDYLKKSKEEL